jgi:hypothetical protein
MEVFNILNKRQGNRNGRESKKDNPVQTALYLFILNVVSLHKCRVDHHTNRCSLLLYNNRYSLSSLQYIFWKKLLNICRGIIKLK